MNWDPKTGYWTAMYRFADGHEKLIFYYVDLVEGDHGPEADVFYSQTEDLTPEEWAELTDDDEFKAALLRD